MTFNPNAYNTMASEVPAIGDTGASLAPGTAVKLVSLPTGLATPDSYFKVAAAGAADEAIGVVSRRANITITPSDAGRVVLFSSGLVAVKANASIAKGDKLKVATADGKFEAAMAGDLSLVSAQEAAAMGDLLWALPLRERLL